MSLITRCPACGTMFKVVTDQLKVSHGWVRCGQCAEVFDASTHLLPGETAALPPAALTPDQQPAFSEPAPSPAMQEPAEPVESAAEPPWAPARSFADRVPLRPSVVEQDAEAQDSAADFDPAGWKQAVQDRHRPATREPQDNPAPVDTPPRRPDLVHTATADESGFESSDLPDSGLPHDVSFVRDARRRAFRGTPLARWSLAGLSLALLAALALQWVIQQKDTLAALDPRLGSLLQTVCQPLRCEIRAPRHIDSLAIDSSSFNRIGPDAYRLSFALKNIGAIPLEVPYLELTLTDTQDQPVVRRILAPAEFAASTGTLAARSELAGVVSMKVSADSLRSASSSSPPPAPLRVAGYRVLAFYP